MSKIPGSLPDAKRERARDPPRMVSTHRSGSIRLVIELDGDDGPIEGELVEPAGHASSFRGWLALTALIEAARGHGGPQSSGCPPDASPLDRREPDLR
jgi:hypothetical protein